MRKSHAGLVGVALAVGAFMGAAGLSAIQGMNVKFSPIDIREIRKSSAALTSPLLECGELSQRVSDETLSSLKDGIQKLLDTATKDGDIIYASVYFRDLNNGPWFGVNESDEFFPASLLKLPLAMSFYNAADDDPSILTKEITYTPDPSTAVEVQPFGPQKNVEAGKKYTVKELLTIMLQESSNEVAVALAGIAGPAQITGVYRDLGLKPPTFGNDYKIDTHKYASFFRILYNATYINREDTEVILRSLAEASFKDGLVAGVPASVTVAHKFGSRQVDASGKVVQLHDCGIVYATGRPYILCVMTQGSDFTKLAGFIKGVSELVYTNVTKDNL